VALGSLLIVAFAASSGYDVWRSYRRSLQATDQALTTLSRALAEQAARSFQSVDLIMRDTASWYANYGDRFAPELARERLAQHAVGLPLLGIVVLDAERVPRYSWFSSRLPEADIPDPARFSALRDGVDERGRFVFSRAVERSGRLFGTVRALIELDEFQRFYGAIDLVEGTRVLLLREDGLVLALQPAVAGAIGHRFLPLAAARGLAAEPATLIVSSFDGVSRFVAASAVPGHPFVVAVTRDRSAVLAPWWAETVHAAVRTLALSLIGALLIAVLVRQLARIEAAEDEQARLEGQLRQSQKMEAMGTLAGGIAHDFNNILGAILGYGEMALRGAKKGTRLRRDLDSIMSAGERGRALIDRILAFSRSGVGERVAVHVEAVVREALDLLGGALPEGVRLRTDLRAGRAAMLGDPTQVHQVVMNLATNGLQAMPQAGVLRVTLEVLRFEAPRAASIGAVSPGEYIVLKVADSGTGIAPQVLERMFDPFFSTKEVGVGSGLGLSLVHGIVANVGGAIDVATELGKGTTFTVYLPRNGDAVAKPVDERRPLPRGAGQRVLIVDDEEPLVALATRTLEELGYAPVGFTSSSAALAAFRADPQRFDAVITDERMPGISGSSLIREVRGIRDSIPVVLMSGYLGAPPNVREGVLLDALGVVPQMPFGVGADEVLRKPLSARELATSLARVLQH